ncbi:MAG: Xaa-Pro peptidase family protein [Candidatus Bathyarchaeia archaeon]|jgi:Xaa-Pro aminopeptidase
MKRFDALKQSAAKQGLACDFLIFNPYNIAYFTGFSGATALLIPEQGENTLFVGGVNFEQAKNEAKGLTVNLLKRGENIIEKIVKQAPAKKYAVDALTFESWRILAKAVGGEEKLEPAGSLMLKLRSVKDKEEIGLIRDACKLASEGMQVASELIRPGSKEKEVAAEVEYAMRKKGSDGTSFDTIIASGASSAYPHGSCSSRTIREGELVVVDLGANFGFYRSDMTRTFAAGKPYEKQRKVYETVKAAHQKAFETIKPGVQAQEVDAAARRTIEAAGFGDFFVHNLGHGVGLEIHEAPVLSPDSKDTLAEGNVVTDEPGIYIPGYGGVRIEDTVLITAAGAEKLTVGPYILACTS